MLLTSTVFPVPVGPHKRTGTYFWKYSSKK